VESPLLEELGAELPELLLLEEKLPVLPVTAGGVKGKSPPKLLEDRHYRHKEQGNQNYH